MKYTIFIILLFLLLPLPVLADPNLLITPLRVELEPRMRSASLTLVNNGDTVGTYRISVINKRMDKEGVLRNVPTGSAAAEGEFFAGDMIRISPRRVTIPPQGSQTVRLMVRKPAGLAAGEYRSHLVFTLDPTFVPPTAEAPSPSPLEVRLKAEVGISIPLIVRQGDLPPATGTIREAMLQGNTLRVALTRSGQRSLYGDVTVRHVAPDGKETVLAAMNGIAVYVPNRLRYLTIPITIPPSLTSRGGKLTVTYAVKKEQGGEVIASREVGW